MRDSTTLDNIAFFVEDFGSGEYEESKTLTGTDGNGETVAESLAHPLSATPSSATADPELSHGGSRAQPRRIPISATADPELSHGRSRARPRSIGLSITPINPLIDFFFEFSILGYEHLRKNN
ncbi:hypothetical protein Bca4012_036641 [Brassica carinata]